ncbi:Lsr2 family protein [Saccharopolyspora sp. NPDC050389]|uniref:histone-like nucleoid-structuring protein Lsr2 n=1 Tax=Saccharopolyspora sp. NPDC050389 TaxID=3155516 RepID=UPI0033C1EE91
MVELVDDIDGSPAGQTTMFSLDGVTYEIDLNARHTQDLRSLLEHYITHARREPARGGNRGAKRDRRRAREVDTALTAQIREAAHRARTQVGDKSAAEQAAHRDAGPPVQITVVESKAKQGPRNVVCAPELAPPQFSSL